MKKHFISASKMAKKYSTKRALAEQFYLDVLQPEMVAVANLQNFYIIERYGDEWGREYFPELGDGTEVCDISMYVCELLGDLGYDCEVIPSYTPGQYDLAPGYSRMIIRWDK